VNTDLKNFEFSGKMQKISIVLIVLGIAASVASFSIDKTVGWVDFIVNNLYFVTLAASGIFILSLAGVLQASWLAPYKRIPEAMTKYLPVGFVLMLCVYFGSHTIYEWTHTEMVANDPILSAKAGYLNITGFMGRMVVIFLVWIVIAKRLTGLSVKQDTDDSQSLIEKITLNSVISLILYSLSFCVAAFDWYMSVEPHWFSTIFGVYVFAGAFVTAFAFITIIVIKLKDWGYFEGVINENHLHDLGKWMFGFSTFWAYIWLSQYLLIWYANIPEETEYYVLRGNDWNAIFFFNLIINWLAPFFLLMTRKAKRSPKRLMFVATLIIIGHFIDTYLMIAPKVFHHAHAHITGFGSLQLLQWLGYLGLFIFVTGKALAKKNLVAIGDPNLDEGIHLHQ